MAKKTPRKNKKVEKEKTNIFSHECTSNCRRNGCPDYAQDKEPEEAQQFMCSLCGEPFPHQVCKMDKLSTKVEQVINNPMQFLTL